MSAANLGKTQGQWSAFADAVDSLRTNARDLFFDEQKRVADLIEQSVKFYFPSAVNVLDGKRYTADVKDLLVLPFDCVSVLSDTTLNDTGRCVDGGDVVRTITLALRPGSNTNQRYAIADPTADPAGSWAYLWGLVYAKEYRAWISSGASILLAKSEDDGIQRFLPNTPRARYFLKELGWDAERLAKEMTHDQAVVENLCVMLGMHNVRTAAVEPDSKLQRARERRGKLPLWSYHVLNVDGTLWDRPETDSIDDRHGYRSHLRRGHVRRLSAERRVWVRAAYVKGSEGGFVDKSYALTEQHKRCTANDILFPSRRP